MGTKVSALYFAGLDTFRTLAWTKIKQDKVSLLRVFK